MPAGLAGIQVLEIASGVAAAYAAKLLADLGATVVKVEPPTGDPSRRRGPFRKGQEDPEASGEYLALNANKRSMVLDLTMPQGRERLGALAARANLLVHSCPPARMAEWGLDYETLSAQHPGLVMLSITPYGLDGAYRDYAAHDLTIYHGTGAASVMPDPRSADLAPVKFFGPQMAVQAGLYGATAALAVCMDAQRTGVGDHLDVAMHEVNASFPMPFFHEWSYTKKLGSRKAPMFFAPAQFFACRDGFVYITCPQEHQWKQLVALMGNPAWCDEPRFATLGDRGANRDALNEHLAEWTRTWSAEDLFRTCQEHRIAATKLYLPSQLVAHDHLAQRDFVQWQNHPVAGRLPMPGAPWVLREPWWALRTPAPLLGEANGEAERLFQPPPPAPAGEAPALPLAGVRVLDMTWVWAGPHCTEMLTFLGAEVLKIESSKRPDVVRQLGPVPTGMEPGVNRRSMFNQYNQGKQSLTIDITKPEGLALVKRLAAVSDVTASNFSYGVMDRFGLSAEEFQRINPDIIVLMISGFGQSGPLKEYIAYGQTVLPLGGMIAMPDAEGQLPQYPSGSGDPNSGIYGAFGIVAALLARRLHGGGQFIDASLWENMIPNAYLRWINEALGNTPYPYMANQDPQLAPHNLFPTAGTDQWIAIAVNDETEWQALCRVMGQPALANDGRFATMTARKQHEAALDAIIGAWSKDQDKWALTELLQQHHVPAFPSTNAQELLQDPQLKARGLFREIDHPEVGRQTHIGVPWHTTRRPTPTPGRAPLMGEHTDQALQRVLGLTTPELAELRNAGVIE